MKPLRRRAASFRRALSHGTVQCSLQALVCYLAIVALLTLAAIIILVGGASAVVLTALELGLLMVR